MPSVKKPKTKPPATPVKNVKKTIPVVSGQLKKKLEVRKKKQKPQRGVVFVKHLPHGFFEEQIRKYFEQFGNVTRLRLARSKITGGTKGYAFVEFEYPEVAQVAAETMENYLMFNRVVQAAYIPPEKQLYNFFKTSVRKVTNKAGKPIYVSSKTADINRRVKKFNDWTEEAYQKRTVAKQKRIKQLNEKYGHLGIDFNAIMTGSKKIDPATADSTNKESNAEPQKKTKTKTIKRKPSLVEETKSNKKTKKTINLEDLLGSTLNGDSDDEDYVVQSDEETKLESQSEDDSVDSEDMLQKELDHSMGLEDLLGATLNEDSDDEDYDIDELEAEDESDEDVDVQSENEENECITPKKTNKSKVNKTTNKVKTQKVDRMDEIIKRKKHVGGVQKAGKTAQKKSKLSIQKNALQAAMAKQLAQPLPKLKKPTKKQDKKQKK